MVIGVALYFLLGSALLAWLCLPGLREQALPRARRTLARCQARAGHRAATLALVGRPGWQAAQRCFGEAGRVFFAHRGRALLALALLIGVPMLALGLRVHWRVDGFDHTRAYPVDPHIAALLQGEQLVPPPAPPPALFAAPEVEQARPLTRDASRRWDLLDPEFHHRLLLLFKLMKERHGYELVLLEGYRSPERQAELHALGTTVTRAGAFASQHQHGLAADVAFLRDGRIVISEQDPWAMQGYGHYGALATTLGLTWGGDWPGLRDYGHVELRRPPAPGRPPPAAHATTTARASPGPAAATAVTTTGAETPR